MKLLVVHPGASYATGDVLRGYHSALTALGVEVVLYALDQRIDLAAEFYAYAYKKQGLKTPPSAVILQHAAGHIVPMALYHDVDGVVVFSGMVLAPDVFILLHRAGIPTALVLSESPYDDAQQARILARRDKGRHVVDVAFTNERSSVATLGAVHPRVSYLPHAFDPATSYVPDAPVEYTADVLLVGTMFEERVALLSAIDWEREGIDLALYGMTKTIASRSRLRRHIRGAIVENADAQALYRSARINLNPYRTSKGFGHNAPKIDRAESLNPRALELAACGAFQLSDYRPEVAEVFGDLVPTYRTPGELLALIRYYLQHEEERDAKAKALPGAVSGHTYAARAGELIAHIEAAWSPPQRKVAAIGALSR